MGHSNLCYCSCCVHIKSLFLEQLRFKGQSHKRKKSFLKAKTHLDSLFMVFLLSPCKMAMYYVSRHLDLWTRWSLPFASTPLYNGSLAEVFHLHVNFMCFIWHILLHFSISSVILEEMSTFNHSSCIKYSIVQ